MDSTTIQRAGLVLGCPLFKIASLALAWRVFMLLVWRLLHHPLACTLYFYPVYTAQPRPCRVLPPLTSTWGFHVADAAHRGITMPSVCPTPFNISNAYPFPRRGVTMCSALPPASSLACTLYWRHVPPHSDQRNSLPFVSHFIPLASALYFYPVYTATAPPPAP